MHARTGAALHPTFWPAKIRWIARTSPTVHDEVASWLSFGDYLLLRWFGRAQSSLSMASATGLMDQSRLTWDEAMVGAARVKTGTLPEIIAQPFPGIDIRDGYRGRWPALARARWLPAVGDGACSNLGVGAMGVVAGPSLLGHRPPYEPCFRMILRPRLRDSGVTVWIANVRCWEAH